MTPLVKNGWFSADASPATIPRKIHQSSNEGGLTFLFDEADAKFKGNPEAAQLLRGILNSGYKRSGTYTRCVGKGADLTPFDFKTFCPKAIAGIAGHLPDTVSDRSIHIHLKRAPQGAVKRWSTKEEAPLSSLAASEIAPWAKANLQALRRSRPEIPRVLSPRQAEVSETLLAIADLADEEWRTGTRWGTGPNWGQWARNALLELYAGAQAQDDSPGVRLLTDIRAIFAERTETELPSAELSTALAKIETSPWGEWSHGKPISPAKVARLLGRFGIHPDRIGGKGSQLRGYQLSQFADAFSRYLPPESVNPSTERENIGQNEDFKPSTETLVDTSEKSGSPNENGADGHFDTLKRGDERESRGNGLQETAIETAQRCEPSLKSDCHHCDGTGECPCPACTLRRTETPAPCSMCRTADHQAWVAEARPTS